MKKFIVLVFSLIYIYAGGQPSISTYTAGQPQLIPSSPQAAQFARYGDIPVGHSTGVPQIDVPIYTLNTGWIDIPISISYHASGFRVRDIPSPVGLGWVLNAGGLITRSVECLPDFESSIPLTKDGFTFNSASQIDSLKNGTKQWNYATGNYYMDLSQWGNMPNWENFFFDTKNKQGFDTRSDRYVYNFLDNSGVARYDVTTNQLLPVPYNPIKIKRIADNDYVITDTKGIKYEFAYPEGTLTSSGGYNVATAWYLTKITYPGRERDSIVFSYQYGAAYYETIYSQTTSIIPPNSINPPYSGVNPALTPVPSQGKSDNVFPILCNYQSPILTSIKWRNVTVQFNYAMDRKDQRKERLLSVMVKSDSNIVKQALLYNNNYFGNEERNYRLRLDGITLCGSDTATDRENYSFNYNTSMQPPDYYRYAGQNSSIHVPICNEDYWGYYNESNADYLFPNEIGGYFAQINGINGYGGPQTANRNPCEGCTETDILNEIDYPTKGKTTFQYELNQIPNAYASVGYHGDQLGGLRLKKRTNYSYDGTITDVKEYEYEGYLTMPLEYEMFGGIIGTSTIPYEYLIADASNGFPASIGYTYLTYATYMYNSSPNCSITGWYDSPVFYDKVTEYEGDGITNIGKTIYTSSENQTVSSPTASPYDGSAGYTPLYFSKYDDWDKGLINPLPVSTVVLDKKGDTVKSIQNTYYSYQIPDLHTGVHVVQTMDFHDLAICLFGLGGTGGSLNCNCGVDHVGSTSAFTQDQFSDLYLNNIVSVDNYALQQVSLPKSTTETDYVNGKPAIVNTNTYSYRVDNGKPVSFQPDTVLHTNSNGIAYMEITKYPFDYTTEPYSDMAAANIIDPVINKTLTGSTSSEGIQNNYREDGSQFVIDNVQSGKNGALEQRISYPNYDTYGNLLYFIKDNSTKEVYLWGYKGKYPVAKIIGIDFNAIKNAQIDTAILNNGSETQIETQLSSLRSYFKSNSLVQVTTCTYTPLIGMASETDPKGYTIYYKYDNLGRLQYIKDQDNNIVKQFYYNYAQQSTNYSGYTNYYNAEKSITLTVNNCSPGATASQVTYIVPANKYSSIISQADADQQAQNDINTNGQTYANENGSCTFYSAAKSGVFTRNDCVSGGSRVTYTVKAGNYWSRNSQAEADSLAQVDVNTNGQFYANTNGTCSAYYFYNTSQSVNFTRNNCGANSTGSSVPYSVDAGVYKSAISQADANQQALNYINANGQSYANTYGLCGTFVPITVSNSASSNCYGVELSNSSAGIDVFFDLSSGNSTLGNFITGTYDYIGFYDAGGGCSGHTFSVSADGGSGSNTTGYFPNVTINRFCSLSIQ